MWQDDFTYSFFAFLKKFITKCDKQRKFHEFQINYYKGIKNLLHSVTGITKCDRYYKVWQVLQSVARSYYKVWQVLQRVRRSYYKVWQVLQSVAIITKWNVTERKHLLMLLFHKNKDSWSKDQNKNEFHTAQKMKFFIKVFFSKCDQICRKLRIWSHLLKKSFMENFIICAVEFHFISPALKTNVNRNFFMAKQSFILRRFHLSRSITSVKS